MVTRHNLSHPLPSRTVLYSVIGELLLWTLEAAALKTLNKQENAKYFSGNKTTVL